MGCFQDFAVGTKGDFFFPLSTSTVQEGGLFTLKSRIIGLESKGNSSLIWSVGWLWVPLFGNGGVSPLSISSLVFQWEAWIDPISQMLL